MNAAHMLADGAEFDFFLEKLLKGGFQGGNETEH